MTTTFLILFVIVIWLALGLAGASVLGWASREDVEN